VSAAVTVTAVSNDTLEDDLLELEEMSLLALTGELDYTNAERLQHDLQEAIGPRARDLVIDLSDLSFCDSTGIQVFLAVRKITQDRGGSIALTGLQPRLERLFHLTGLASAFGIQPTVTDAVEVFRSRQSSP
jgi:anti-sigma B factor antagonist/stage II sporulation protein AA (anti-sigma F factor antagonist)